MTSFRNLCLLACWLFIGTPMVNAQLKKAQLAPLSEPRLIFLGDSLTAGFGLDLDEAYPALIQEKLEAAGIKMKVVNAGVSGDTSAGGLRRLDWLLREPVSMLVIALGANDGLRGLSIKAIEENLRAIIKQTRLRNPQAQIVLTSMLVPPNQGKQYADAFRNIFVDVAESENITSAPFLLEGVAGHPDKNQSDGVHPNREGQQIIAETLWKTLEPLLRKGN